MTFDVWMGSAVIAAVVSAIPQIWIHRSRERTRVAERRESIRRRLLSRWIRSVQKFLDAYPAAFRVYLRSQWTDDAFASDEQKADSRRKIDFVDDALAEQRFHVTSILLHEKDDVVRGLVDTVRSDIEQLAKKSNSDVLARFGDVRTEAAFEAIVRAAEADVRSETQRIQTRIDNAVQKVREQTS